MRLLIQARGDSVHRASIAAVLGAELEGSRLVDTTVSRLRSALRAVFGQNLIGSRRGVGYALFEPVVTERLLAEEDQPAL
jgi:DNA-binding response OmpR family regulator